MSGSAARKAARADGPTPPDRALCEAIARGEPEVIDRVRRWIRGAAGPFRSSLGADLEDLEQDVLLSLTETLRDGAFEGRSSLATYVKKAVVYRCLNRVRDARKRTFVPTEEVRLEWRGPNPHRETTGREEVEWAFEVLARMSDECRELWRMVQEGSSYPEMATRLGVAAGTLRVRMLRCRRKAHELWERLTGTSR